MQDKLNVLQGNIIHQNQQGYGVKVMLFVLKFYICNAVNRDICQRSMALNKLLSFCNIYRNMNEVEFSLDLVFCI